MNSSNYDNNDDYYKTDAYLNSLLCPTYDLQTKILDNNNLKNYIFNFNNNNRKNYTKQPNNYNNITINHYIDFLDYLKNNFLKKFFEDNSNIDDYNIMKNLLNVIYNSTNFIDYINLFIMNFILSNNLFDNIFYCNYKGM